MKKLLIIVAAAVLSAACANKTGNTKNDAMDSNVYYGSAAGGAQSAKDAKYQIIDQEFDNMLAPESDYETLSAYELQACGDSYLPPAELKKSQKKTGVAAAKKTTKKAKANVTKNKKVTNNVTVHYIDGPAPVPTGTISSSTTTTTTTNSSSSSSSYAGGTGSSYSNSGGSYSSSNSYSSF